MLGDNVSITGRFATTDALADVTVVIVTYNSSDHIERLLDSLRADACTLSLRVIVADNASTDGTLRVVQRHDDVVTLSTGGNLGYAAGINAATAMIGRSESVLILNPDLWVEPGCVTQLRARMLREKAGIVVPRIRDDNGSTYTSLRREPSLARAFGDAALGSRILPKRHGALSEIVADPEIYERPHAIEWATGAAMLIAGAIVQAVGPWDERFFLYSEETDYFRRVRQQGATVWYEPEAVVHHAQGGSGSSAELDSLMTVNRIRYVRKHHGQLYAGIYRAAVAFHEVMRIANPTHRTAFRTVMSESRWRSLPQAQSLRQLDTIQDVSGAIIIPAHNEATVIRRTLQNLGPLVKSPLVDVIVAANGCSDDTVSQARTVTGAQVIEIPEPSKTSALNTAEEHTNRWPRIYLDADIEITPRAVLETFTALSNQGTLAARPRYIWDLTGASWIVRRYYGARGRIPSVHDRLWGAGVYGLSQEGRRRFSEFPKIVADDLFIDQQFREHERRIVATDPVVVRAPRSLPALLSILRRQSRGSQELGLTTSPNTGRELLGTIRGPVSFIDAVVYAVLATLSRRHPPKATRWERDESSRVGFEQEDGYT